MSSKTNFDRNRFRYFYKQMCRIRHFEKTAIKAKTENLVLGAIHPSIGQEAAAVGVCENLNRNDILLSTHRGHGHTLSKGASANSMMLELLGRNGGSCAGKGGSMHIADFNVGMLGANGVVGANINIGVGAAHAIKLKGENRIVVCIFGDGAINRGPFLEGLNWAKIYNLPILFICEDNMYAATTKTVKTTAGKGVIARAQSLGLEAQSLNGNDILEVDHVAQVFIAKTRQQGPMLLHLRTYRLSGHTSTDQATYRPSEETKMKWLEDPIAICADLLRNRGVPQNELTKIDKDAFIEMAEVYQAAKLAQFPSPARAYEDVQDIGDPRVDCF